MGVLMSASQKWYLVQLKPNGFDRAVVNLERQNIHSFMAHRKVLRRVGQRQTQKKQPLFPGYLFIHINPSTTQWRSINSTYGVSRIVSFGSEKPPALPDQLISGIKLRCDEEDCLLPPVDLKIGEQVKIISGPFADFVATIETMPSQTRLGLLFEFLGQKTPVQIGHENVERVGHRV